MRIEAFRVGSVFLLMAGACFAAADRQYAITYLPLSQTHYSEAIAVNAHGQVLVRDDGDLSSCCGGRVTSIYLWSEKAGLQHVIDYADGLAEPLYLNDRGEVAGTLRRLNTRIAFIWSAGRGIRELLQLELGSVTGINRNGDVLGNIVANGAWTGFIAAEGSGVRYLPGGTAAWGINDKDIVVGTIRPYCPSGQVCFDRKTFIWTEKGGLRDIATPSGFGYSEGLAVNDRGEALGIACEGCSTGAGAWTLFKWTEKNGLTGTWPLPPSGCSGMFFDQRGDIAMTCYPAAYFRSADGAVRVIDAPGGSVYANGIGDGGEVVGGLRPSFAVPGHAFVWTESMGLIDLDPLSLGPASIANAINKDGLIVGAAGSAFPRAAIWRLTKP
jgi:uncharacterized membrane protein